MKTISIKVTKNIFKQIKSIGEPKIIVKQALDQYLKNKIVTPVKIDTMVLKNIESDNLDAIHDLIDALQPFYYEDEDDDDEEE